MLDLFRPKVARIYGPRTESGLTPAEQERRERKRAYWQAYHLKHRAARLKAMKERYEANKPEYVEKAKKWRQANPQKSRAIKRRSDAIHRNKRLRLPSTSADESHV